MRRVTKCVYTERRLGLYRKMAKWLYRKVARILYDLSVVWACLLLAREPIDQIFVAEGD